MNFFFANIGIIIVNTSMFYYVINRFFHIFDTNTPKRISITIATIISIIMISTIMYHGNSKILDIIGTFSSWLFVLGFLLTIALFCEQIIGIWYKINPRIFSGLIILILGLGIFFSLKTKITTYDIDTDKIPQDTKILLVSDIHTDHIYKSFHIKKIQKAIDTEKPNFVLIAGDLMNKSNIDYPNYFSVLNSDKYPPIIAIMGNHDVMGDTQNIDNIPQKSSIKLLKNESIEIDGIQIIGIIDKSTRGNSILEDNLDKSNINYDDNKFGILLTHQPISLEKLKNYPIDLEVAGHTHRGQFYGMRKVVQWLNDYAYGEYKLGEKTAIVTQGIGAWGLPFRLGTQSEMVIINLHKTK